METCFVSCNLQGLEVRGTVLKLERFKVAFELYQPSLVLRVSELLEPFKVLVGSETAYAGRALVTNLVYLGTLTTCEVKLEEPGIQPGALEPSGCVEKYSGWFESWQQQERLQPDFKLSVLSLHSYLSDFKALCERLELSILAHPSRPRADAELEVAQQLAPQVFASMNSLRERFIECARGIEPDRLCNYEVFVQRHLHPLFLCAPFGYRTFAKPLGYAGDYEMMNMIHRNGFEGGSLYARLVHHWLVNQPPAKSVRTRTAHLRRRLFEETARVHRLNRPARILNLGCGPAKEVQDFIAEHPLANEVEITLLDFDEETLEHVRSALNRARTTHGRRTVFQTRRMSVTQLLRESSQPGRNAIGTGYDFIYCGGLCDYLSPRICRQLVGMLYQNASAGGLLVVANMWDEFQVFSEMLEFLLDWHLLYRSARDLESFIPDSIPRNGHPVSEDGINLFLELRKPEGG
jgi:extracellular factor (EF) 3-hydroxypalmitic acid methyl ester biosynthesis protein